MKCSSIESFVNYEIILQAREPSYAAGCEKKLVVQDITQRGRKYVRVFLTGGAGSLSGSCFDFFTSSRSSWSLSGLVLLRSSRARLKTRVKSCAPPFRPPISLPFAPPSLIVCVNKSNKQTKILHNLLKPHFLTSIHSTFSTQSPNRNNTYRCVLHDARNGESLQGSSIIQEVRLGVGAIGNEGQYVPCGMQMDPKVINKKVTYLTPFIVSKSKSDFLYSSKSESNF